MLVLGILLWSVAHLFVALGVDQRQQLIAKIGLNPYKGLFSLTLVLALVLIVMGWKAMPQGVLYAPLADTRYLTMLLMPFAVILFISARADGHQAGHPSSAIDGCKALGGGASVIER